MKPETLAKIKKYNARIPVALERDSAAIEKKLRKPRIHPMERLSILYALLDRYAEYSNGLVACKSGCSFCCHSEVAVSSLEADYIASNTAAVKMTPDVFLEAKSECYCDPFRPCSFLGSTGLCAIYAYRPMMCRTHWSFESTSTPCSFDSPPDGDIVLLNRDRSWPGPMAAYVYLTKQHGGTWADIRQWFPSGIRTAQADND